MYENPELCAKCGGECCNRHPGAYMPEDFLQAGKQDMPAALEAAFASGMIVVDWWEGDPRSEHEDWNTDNLSKAYYVRPRMLQDEEGIFCAGWWGTCIFLEPTGCKLGADARPSGCKLLEPRAEKDGDCKCVCHGATKKDASIAWIPHTDVLLEAARRFEGSE